jgi:hypothetical protein
MHLPPRGQARSVSALTLISRTPDLVYIFGTPASSVTSDFLYIILFQRRARRLFRSFSPFYMKMAYPLQFSAGNPHTPRHGKAADTSRNSVHRKTLPTPAFRRKTALLWLLFSMLLLWCIGRIFKPSGQTDRIPFSHEPIAEQVIRINIPSDPS